MDNFRRLFPFLYPHRRRLDCVADLRPDRGGAVGANLTVAFSDRQGAVREAEPRRSTRREIATATGQDRDAHPAASDDHREDAALERQGCSPRTPAPSRDPPGEWFGSRDASMSPSRSHQQVLWLQCYVLPLHPRDKLADPGGDPGGAARRHRGQVRLPVLPGGPRQQRGRAGHHRRPQADARSEPCKNDYESLSQEGTAGLMSRFTYDDGTALDDDQRSSPES